MIPSAFNNIL
jgi:hypothetical protein